MRRLFASIVSLVMVSASPAFAVMEDYPSVKLQGLDKSVGRTMTFEAKVGSTIQYGPLFIKINSCRKAPPIEKPESAAFLQIWEVPPGEQKSEWVFSGWMFASSPALSAMDHPVYDVWVLDCIGKDPVEEVPTEDATTTATDTVPSGDQTATPGVGQDTLNDGSAAPAGQSAIPTDSEAEEDDGNQAAPVTEGETVEPAPATTPAEQNPATPQSGSGAAMDSESGAYTDDTQVQQAAPVTPQQIPEDDKGMTAYDYMKRQQGGQQPAPVPQPAPQPGPVY